MPPLSVQRRRNNLAVKLQDNLDELSESGTSGSSYKPSDSSEDLSSSVEDSASENDEQISNINSKNTDKRNEKTNFENKKNLNKIGDSCSQLQPIKSGFNINEKTETNNTVGVSTNVKDLKIDSKKGHKKVFKKETVQNVCSRLKKGESMRAIANDLSISEKIIKQWNEKFVVNGEPIGGSKKKVVVSKEKTTSEDQREKSKETVTSKSIGKVDNSQKIQEKDEEKIKKTISEELDEIDSNASSGNESDINEILKIPIKNRTAFCRNVVRREAIKRLKRGDMLSKVAKDLGLTTKIVRDWRRQYAPDVTTEAMNKLENYKNVIARACNLLKEGASVEDVAKKLHIDAMTIGKWKKRYIKETEDGQVKVEINQRKRYDKDTIIEACKRLKQGDPIHDIANDLGVIDISTIKSWYVKYHDKEPDFEEVNRKYDKQMRMEVVNRFKKGEFPKLIAKEFGINVTTVYDWRREFDGEVLERKGVTKYHKDIILELCKRMQRGESLNKLGRLTGISKTTLNKWCEVYMKNGRIKITESSAQDVWKFDKNVISKACEKLKNGASVRIVAQKIGITNKSLLYWQRKYFPQTKSDLTSDSEDTYADMKKDRKLRSFTRDSDSSKLTKNDLEETDRTNDSVIDLTKNPLINGQSTTPDKNCLVVNLVSEESEANDAESLMSFEETRSPKINKIRRVVQDVDYHCEKSLSEQNCAKLLDKNLKRKAVANTVTCGEMNRKAHEIDSSFQDLMKDYLTNVLSIKRRARQSQRLKKFVPVRKVHIPRSTKLEVVRMIDGGASIAKLSRELNINKITLKSWMMNKNLLEKGFKP